MNSLQDQMDKLNGLIQDENNKGTQGNHPDMIKLQQDKKDLQSKIDAQTAESAIVLQDSIQANGYWLDTVTIADVPVSECGMYEPVYNILKEKVEAKIVGITDSLTKQLADQQTASQTEAKRLNDLNSQLTESSIKAMQENIQLKADNESISTSRDNAARMLEEANAQIEQQKNHIADLQAQIAVGVRGAIQVESTDAQIKQQEQALKASRIKVISMVKNDPSGVSDRLWDIVLASNGEQVTINYLEKGKYTVISADEAAQAQADIEASKNIPELKQIDEEPAAAPTPQEAVQTATSNVDGNGSQTEVVGEATQATVEPQPLDQQLAQLFAAHNALQEDHNALKVEVRAISNNLGMNVAAA